MAALNHKIDFVALVCAEMANTNGDPLNGNRPRTTYDGYGEISDVCIKRKIRNRMQDMGNAIFVQSDDRCDDGIESLKERAVKELGDVKGKKSKKDRDTYAKMGCEKWIDVRSFGQVFAFEKDEGESKGVSIGVRGPISIHQARSVAPVEIVSMQITKSVNGNPKDIKGHDTMGMKHMVRHGLYVVKGSINVQLAEKTGFSQEDADTVKECLRTLFVNDASSARPDGSMEVVRLYWFQHNSKDGQYSTAKVHRSVKVQLKDGVLTPAALDDYEISLEELPGLTPEVLEGV